MVENGIRIEPVDAYSRRNLKIYISDLYLGPEIVDEETGEVIEETLLPSRDELEGYEIELSRAKLKSGQHLMIINTGREIGRFTITGYAEPETVLAEHIPPPEPPPRPTPPVVAAPAPPESGGMGGVIGGVVGAIVVIGALVGFFMVKKRKAEQI